jgi:hypothetical protein
LVTEGIDPDRSYDNQTPDESFRLALTEMNNNKGGRRQKYQNYHTQSKDTKKHNKYNFIQTESGNIVETTIPSPADRFPST